MKNIIICILFIMLTSCVSYNFRGQCVVNGKVTLNCEKISTPSPENALLYIYRPYIFFQGGSWPVMWIDSHEIGPLYNYAFVILSVKPGTYSVQAKKTNIYETWVVPDFGMNITLEAGKTYFLRVAPVLGSVFSVGYVTSVGGTGSMGLVKGENAKVEMKKAKYLGSATYTK